MLSQQHHHHHKPQPQPQPHQQTQQLVYRSPKMLPSRRSHSSQHHPESLSSKYRAGKSRARPREQSHSIGSRRLHRRDTPPDGSSLNPDVITVTVGPTKRLFAAHKDILCVSPYFAAICARSNNNPSSSSSSESSLLTTTPSPCPRNINLPDEQPEVFSCVLEYLYRGDYYPRLQHDKTRDTWRLETTGSGTEDSAAATMYSPAAGAEILRDTAVYCLAQKFSLETLKRLSLKKQGLHSNIPCSTILTSARYAYARTPDNESKLRAHYLALIIRSRETFKRSGTMQMEMEQGGKLFFDLFVAMCNHMDDLTDAAGGR
ncbi:hypothetical protein BO70DRAFT_361787 [Aspergillus heteromorphus CBS 117.55]|uniref:BTB domain-containing protein n=1 Tax=Aspergillus heteromorphus CBS 117.55 TaxID=1448321 RepID=A0A317WCV6_9EURO|nr:uncharacterized protein BO70DRAFT_361787 [Aspergillus heteromorphus CBS 117.55]PWY82868.1 hypothetical protein BO70DRAFT_361787 [Aspergillus heteromorphus CBS 117.55]